MLGRPLLTCSSQPTGSCGSSFYGLSSILLPFNIWLLWILSPTVFVSDSPLLHPSPPPRSLTHRHVFAAVRLTLDSEQQRAPLLALQPTPSRPATLNRALRSFARTAATSCVIVLRNRIRDAPHRSSTAKYPQPRHPHTATANTWRALASSTGSAQCPRGALSSSHARLCHSLKAHQRHQPAMYRSRAIQRADHRYDFVRWAKIALFAVSIPFGHR